MHRHVDPVHVVDQRAGLEPVAVRVVEAVDERILEQGPAPLGLVLGALAAGVLERVEAAEGPAADVVGDADRAGPQQGETVVRDAARVDDVAVQVADQARRAHGPQRLRAGRRDEQAGDAAVGVTEDHDLAVGPRLLGDPLVDHLFAVERGAEAEEVELTGRATGAAHACEHGHVAVVDVRRMRRTRAGLEREGQARLVGEVAGWSLALVGAALVSRHLEERRTLVQRVAVRRHLHVDGDARPVRRLHVVGRRRRGGPGRNCEYGGCRDGERARTNDGPKTRH